MLTKIWIDHGYLRNVFKSLVQVSDLLKHGQSKSLRFGRWSQMVMMAASDDSKRTSKSGLEFLRAVATDG